MVAIDFKKEDKVLKCIFSGKMDINASQEASDLFGAKIKEIPPEVLPEVKIVFDLENVDYISSSFLRISLFAAKQINKGNFSVVKTTPDVKKIYTLAGMDEILNVS